MCQQRSGCTNVGGQNTSIFSVSAAQDPRVPQAPSRGSVSVCRRITEERDRSREKRRSSGHTTQH